MDLALVALEELVSMVMPGQVRQEGSWGIVDRRKTKASVLSIKTVEIPAPTAASVNATSGASRTSIQTAPRKL